MKCLHCALALCLLDPIATLAESIVTVRLNTGSCSANRAETESAGSASSVLAASSLSVSLHSPHSGSVYPGSDYPDPSSLGGSPTVFTAQNPSSAE